MSETAQKILYWIPRVLAILFTIFITLFAFDESFLSVGFLMHLIPTLILILITVISWKFELVGGIIFVILGIIWTFFYSTFESMSTFFLISLPIILIGFLFLWNYFLKKQV